jgi:hypothetical protein
MCPQLIFDIFLSRIMTSATLKHGYEMLEYERTIREEKEGKSGHSLFQATTQRD